MPKRRPLIGICASFHLKDGKGPGVIDMGPNYTDAVEKAGGVPVLLPPTGSPELARDMIAHVDGLLVPGGPDIAPSRYGQRKHKTHKPLHPRREKFWFEALAAANERQLPVLGICLGSQLLNVGRGGSLIQDIPSQWEKPLKHVKAKGEKRRLHDVVVEPGTMLAAIVGPGRLEVNSSHHQAVDRPGDGLVVAARATDGVVEATEDPNHPFYLAIQWHPEGLPRRRKHRALFEAFVRAAGGQKP